MKKVSLIVVLGVMLSLLSCTKERVSGGGSIITEQRNVANFTNVYSSGSTEVHILEGAAFKVEVRGYNNLLPYYETKLENGTLKIGYQNNVNVKNDNTEVFITMPELTGLQLVGSGNIHTTGNFPLTNNFETNISGSGNIHIASGSSQNFSSSISGSGNIYAFGVTSVSAHTNTVGSGNTEITATNQLRVKITGSGNVYYKSTPVITSEISGSGIVAPR